MNTNDKQDFYNEVENEDTELVIEPVADDDIAIGMEDSVHLIGGEAFGDDAMGAFDTDAFVMDIDSDGVFGFDVADFGNDGLVDDVEVLDIDSLDNLDNDDAFVMDVDSEGDFDFAVADVNNDGFIDADDVLVTLDDVSSGGFIGYDAVTVPEEDITDWDHPEEPIVDEDLEVEESEGSEIIENTEDLYLEDNDLDYLTDDILDL